MSRRRSLGVELGVLLREAASLEFESHFVVRISDVSVEINRTGLPSVEALGKVAQSALTPGPLAHEQARTHAVADALQSRCSASAGDWETGFLAVAL